MNTTFWTPQENDDLNELLCRSNPPGFDYNYGKSPLTAKPKQGETMSNKQATFTPGPWVQCRGGLCDCGQIWGCQ
jgi:hypothetical protein